MINANFLLVFLVCTFSFFSCKKEAGPDGKKIISGVVYYKNGVSGKNEIAAGAKVQIAYGVKNAVSSYDQTLLTDADGKYTIPGLRKGDYFISASFTDSHGFNYFTAGYAVEIKNKKKELILDIVLE